MKNEIDSIISNLDLKKDKAKINQLIQDYQPFILNTISNLKNEYIQVENDEEFSIGLLAFTEAIQRFDENKGSFLHYAKLVITSRVKTFWQKEQKHEHNSIDAMVNNEQNNSYSYQDSDLRQEVLLFEEELKRFGIDFDDLIDASPKHKDTREKAVDIAVKTSGEEDLVNHIYEKKRLPITKISERFLVSLKIIKKSKLFITAIIIVIVNNYSSILTWIKDSKKGTKSDCHYV
ncbi:RNA polymerase subunit sigma [Sedimentibacter sp. zth1]|uniref:sigma factor n=1 Tax=Sedimentibacter sp. zth1 TaxID=2816908 RepID=UPI001A90F41E|nr:sigma factor [Sedimentibacter sp. zth1]QSX05642.1 RNA polymerase subunit sigma [Sedimentibacter sp. zth1]